MLNLPAGAQPLLRGLYDALARAYLLYLLRRERGAAGYVRASHAAGDAIYGLSDLDLVVVVPGARARRRVRRRAARAHRLTRGRAIDRPLILSPRDLRDVTPSCSRTYGLGAGGAGALYHGEAAKEEERAWIAERPELYGPTAGWRHLRGSDPRAGSPPRRQGVARIAAWSEVQYLWLLAFSLAADPEARSPSWAAYMCLKLQADALRAWLWMAHGERVVTRTEALERARARLPEEEQAVTEALSLVGSLGRGARPPLATALGCLARTSSRIALLLEADAQDAGLSEVTLLWDGPEELSLPHGGWAPGEPEPQLQPLADWRAVASPALPDESFARVPGRPDDPALLAAVAPLGRKCAPYPALLSGELLILPSTHRPRCGMRSAQCAATDPVSFALVNGRSTAAFPNLPGLSARDWAARGVAEHRAWLADPSPPREHTGATLGRLVTAVRAALFEESVDAGEPALALTTAATLRRLGAAGADGVAAEAAGAYAEFATSWAEVPESTLTGLRAAVTSLAAYR